MTKEEKIQSAGTAVGRLFRTYDRHCQASTLDSLFETLTALHSLNDRLRGADCPDLHQFEEFVALKVLRNFAHHEDELHANVRVTPTPAISDLLFMCLVRHDQVTRAIENVSKKWIAPSRTACENCFHWYGEAVNINPCLFNLMVRIYEMVLSEELEPPATDIASFRTSYEFEEEGGHEHFVDGRLTGHAADLQELLDSVVAELPGI